MTTKNTGGPAFPSVNHPDIPINNGATLRDYFAAKALQGMLADHTRDMFKSEFACAAYEYADAMLKARENKE